MLARNPGALRMLMTEAQYHAQVRYTERLLAVVDEVASPETADRITDAIYDRLAGDEVTEAMQRVAEMHAEYARLSGMP